MTTYYELLTDGSIGQNTISQKVALALGLNLSSEKEIVIGYDGKYYFEGEEPSKPSSYRQAEFEAQFFNTSLGYVRRQVSMKIGSTKDFLTDILPMLQIGVPIITYNAPDFSTDIPPTQNFNVLVTQEFLDECKQQLLIDFYGVQLNNENIAD